MNVIGRLACLGLVIVAAAGARAAEPSVEWTMGAGMPTGQMLLIGHPRGGSIGSATLVFNYDAGDVDAPVASDVGVGPGWGGNFTHLNASSFRLDLFNNSGQTSDGVIAGITFKHKLAGFHAATITLNGSSSIDGEDSDSFPGPFFVGEQPAAFVYGKMRRPGAYSGGSVAVGVNNGAPLVADAAGGSLFLMDPADPAMKDLPGWEGGKDVGASTSGRPAFGEVSGALVVAVGTDGGRGLVYNVADGATLSDTALDGERVVGAPAVNGAQGDVYWAVDKLDGGPRIAHQRIGGGTDSVPLGETGDTIVSSPAVWNNMLVIGTGTAARTFRLDPSSGTITPQAAGEIASDDFNTAPIVMGGVGYIGAASGKVYWIQMTTGQPQGSVTLPASAAPLSDPFYDSARGAAVFGGSDGVLYRVARDGTFTTAAVGSTALNSPVITDGETLVSDGGGTVSRLGTTNSALSLHTGPARAMGVVRGATDQLIVNTTNGALVAIPLP